jgi:hypothetical protein
MPARPRPAPQPAPEPDEDPYYEATEDLYVGHPEAGAMPALAYRAGDKVVPDVIDANGWHRQVKVPGKFAGHLDLPAVPGDAPDPAQAGPDHPAPSSPSSPSPAAAQASTPHAGSAGTEE